MSSRDRTRRARQSLRKILPLALYTRRDLLAASVLALFVSPCWARTPRRPTATCPRGRYIAGSVVLGKERSFGQVELLRQIFGLEEDEW